uniref:L(2)rot protein n=1 Tax=Drosophila melanogaster TaxID=7227 RepID=V9H1D8_DROME|nr:Rot(57) protein - fruit fly (Drosophila melanogaster) [Drosophila melanogaster]CAA54836.1 Rot(57) [Drosophila melanogaster]CAA64530.1 l(2)rot [Drosophila melanogaster]CAA66722.1 lethal(2)relative of tid [Drosophila melanogaster]
MDLILLMKPPPPPSPCPDPDPPPSFALVFLLSVHWSLPSLSSAPGPGLEAPDPAAAALALAAAPAPGSSLAPALQREMGKGRERRHHLIKLAHRTHVYFNYEFKLQVTFRDCIGRSGDYLRCLLTAVFAIRDSVDLPGGVLLQLGVRLDQSQSLLVQLLCRWHRDLDVHVMIAVSVGIHAFQTLAAQHDLVVRRGARLHVDPLILVYALDTHSAAQHRLGQGYGHVRVHIGALAPEVVAPLHAERDEQLLAAHLHAHRLPVLDASRHRHGDLAALDRASHALALAARILNVLPRALAVAASGAHHEGPGGHRFEAGAVAVLTATWLGARLALGAGALGALVHHVDVDILVDAARRLGKGQVHDHLLGLAESELGVGEVVERVRSKVALAEDLAEEFLGVDARAELPALRETLGAKATGSSARESAALATNVFRRLAIGVVLTALLLVAEHFVGLGDLLELAARIRILLVRVRMVLLGQLVVGFLDVLAVGVLGNAQRGVVVLGQEVARGVQAAHLGCPRTSAPGAGEDSVGGRAWRGERGCR